MALLGRRLVVSIPDSVLEDKDSLRDKTAKLGVIARACATYGVDTIEVFRDPSGRGEGSAIRRVLEYLETPQYLRKRLYPLDEALRYAGLLPPLRIPSHKPRVPFGTLPVGEVREGVANSDGSVDIGLDVAPRLKEKVPPGKRVSVKVSSLDPPGAELVKREQAGDYWGYGVELKSAEDVLSDPSSRVKIATSRLGTPLSEVLGRLDGAIRSSDSVKLVFGSPSKGLFELFGPGLRSRAEFVVNLFPEQHVETVRTEEAIFAGLGLVSILSAKKA